MTGSRYIQDIIKNVCLPLFQPISDWPGFILKIGCSQVVARQLPAAPGSPRGNMPIPVIVMKFRDRCSLDYVEVVVHSFNQFTRIMELARFEIRVYVISI